MFDLPYYQRLLLLVGFSVVVCGLDAWFYGQKSQRWREYGFVILIACLGGLFGASFDQLSVSLSPDYFRYGKNIAAASTPELRLRVAELGFQAGFFAAILLAMILLVITPAEFPKRFRKILWIVPIIILCALCFAPIGYFYGQFFDPFNVNERFGTILGRASLRQFRSVQLLHLGLYLGALAGFLGFTWRLWREVRLFKAGNTKSEATSTSAE